MFGSIGAVLTNVYPNHAWQSWKFDRVSRAVGKDIDQQRNYVNWLKESLGIQSLDQFYNLTVADFKQQDGTLSISHLQPMTLIGIYQQVSRLFQTKKP